MPTGRYRYGPPSLPRAVASLEATVQRIATQSTTQQDLDKSVPATALSVAAGSYSMTTDLSGADVVNQNITFNPAPIDTSVTANPNQAYPAFYLISYQVVGATVWSAQVRVEDPHDGSQIVLSLPGLRTNTQYIASIITVTTAGIASAPAFVTFTTPGDTVAPPAPSTPTVTAMIANLLVSWNGLTNTAANMPSDFSFCEVHASTSNGFTPSSATLQGSILTSSIGSILGGVKIVPDKTYVAMYVKLVAVDYSGNRSTASAQVGPTTSLKVSGAADVIAGSITAGSIAAGTITGNEIAANSITADRLATGVLDVNQTITVGTPSGTRIEIGKDPLGISNAGIRLYRDQIAAPVVNLDAVTGGAAIVGGLSTGLDGDPSTEISPAYFGNMVINGTFDVGLSSWTEMDASPGNILNAMAPSRDVGTKRSGAASLKLAQPVASPTVLNNDCFMYQMVPCSPSTTYVVSVMVNCVVRTGGALQNRCLGAQGNISAAATWKQTTITGVTGVGVWRQHKISVTTGVSDTLLEVRLYGVSGTGAYINHDNVFMGPADSFYGAMPVSPMVEYVPATADEINGGLYTGEIYNGDTDAATDQTSLLIRTPGWKTPGAGSQASLFLQSDTRTAFVPTAPGQMPARRVDVDPALYSPKIRRGSAAMRGTNFIRCDRQAAFALANTAWTTIGCTKINYWEDDGSMYIGQDCVTRAAGWYSYSATFTLPTGLSGAWGVRWLTQGGSVLACNGQDGVWGFYAVISSCTATAHSYFAGNGYTMAPQVLHNTGASRTFALHASGTPQFISFGQID
jgi:hypothetical protein